MAYKVIHDTFWTDPKIKQLKPEIKLLYLYLITNLHSHYSGIYYLPIDIISLETGMTKKQISASFDVLMKHKFIKYDSEMSVVWIINMAKYQINGAKQIKGAANHFETLHNCVLIKEFLDLYDSLNIPYRYPIEGVYGEYHKEEEEETVTEEETEELKSASITPEEIFNGWNDICGKNGLTRIKSLTPDRRSKVNARLKIHKDVEFWEKVFNLIVDTPFLRGENDRKWIVTFDWLFKNNENALKIFEGNYGRK